jgi:heme/copper-type cytochrome/quinol oxidase subunit 2
VVVAGPAAMEFVVVVIVMVVVGPTGESDEWLLAGAGPSEDTSAWSFAVGFGGVVVVVVVVVVGSAVVLFVSAMKENNRDTCTRGKGGGER